MVEGTGTEGSGYAGVEEADVVVVGGGGSGLAAAVEAALYGARVLLLEKSTQPGGTTGLSVGSITANRTQLQAAAGIADSPQEHFEDMGVAAGHRAHRDNLELRQLYVEEIPATVTWLTQMGVEFFGPLPEPPHRCPRMHNAVPNSRGYLYCLSQRAEHLGVTVRAGMRALRLGRKEGCVVALEAQDGRGRFHLFNARGGVVLATGDFSSSQTLKAACIGPTAGDIEGVNPYSTGDGHRLAMDLGARVVNGDLALGPEIRFIAPPRRPLVQALPSGRPLAKAMKLAADRVPDRWLRPVLMMFLTTHLAPTLDLYREGAILVNEEANRFCNELESPWLRIPKQPNRVAYIIFDNRVACKFSQWPHYVSTAPGVAYAYMGDYARNRKDIYHHGTTPGDLARKMHLPQENLTDAIDGYNRSAGTEGELGERSTTNPLEIAPFHALGPVKSWMVLTDGGLAVTRELEVLDRKNRPIPGLYAAGSTGQGGLLLEGHGHHLGWAFTSGRLAGRNAARRAATQPGSCEASTQTPFNGQ